MTPENNLSIGQLAEKLGQLLTKKGWKLATAESCTGGGLSYWITAIPGSSSWYDRGYVTYNNSAKENMLSIPSSLLNQYGAVSEVIAREMADRALQQSLAQVSVSITGTAGPSGGTEESPVGTVWIGFAIQKKLIVNHFIFKGSRQRIREQAIQMALNKLVELLSV